MVIWIRRHRGELDKKQFLQSLIGVDLEENGRQLNSANRDNLLNFTAKW